MITELEILGNLRIGGCEGCRGLFVTIGGLHLNSFVPQPVSSFTIKLLAQIICRLGIFLFIYRNTDSCPRFIRHFVKMLLEILLGMRRLGRVLDNLT